MRKISLFFGAGAEIAYGMPTGGRFALEIFRNENEPAKKIFKEQRKKIDKSKRYAKWLPDNYENKPISSFGKLQYENLVKGGLEHKRKEILEYMENFDENINYIMENFEKEIGLNIKEKIELFLEKSWDDGDYSHTVQISKSLQREKNIFKSYSFSRILDLSKSSKNKEIIKEAKKVSKAILELYIGALGEEVVRDLNEGLFEKRPEWEIFDDFGNVFSLNYSQLGTSGLEIIFNYEVENINQNSLDIDLVREFFIKILEDIYSKTIDYQDLIDSNWRYLYLPKTDWAKFSKISTFLHTTRDYIKKIEDKVLENIEAKKIEGYYHDVLEMKTRGIEISCIGTTNYNTFIENIIEEKIQFLNGSVNEFYDPYLNRIDSEEKMIGHFYVPFLFTQSGVKPITGIKMSERYVNFYKKFRESDEICIIGFGFNHDDGHINGIFRTLIEDDDKKIKIYHYTDLLYNISTLKSEYVAKLRIKNDKNLEIICVNKDRKLKNGDIWYKELINGDIL